MTSAIDVPNVATHYYMRGRRPFLNLSDLDDPLLGEVVEELGSLRDTAHQRLYGRQYMTLRRLTESRMRALFIEAGGRPERAAPHYFVLGASAWFRGLYAEPEEVVVPLADLPTEVTSVTYPDSFASMAFGPRFGLPHFPQPHHEQVFRLDGLEDLVATYGLPDDSAEDDYTGFEQRPFEKFIEVQLWSDAPIAVWLDTGKRQ